MRYHAVQSVTDGPLLHYLHSLGRSTLQLQPSCKVAAAAAAPSPPRRVIVPISSIRHDHNNRSAVVRKNTFAFERRRPDFRLPFSSRAPLVCLVRFVLPVPLFDAK